MFRKDGANVILTLLNGLYRGGMSEVKLAAVYPRPSATRTLLFRHLRSHSLHSRAIGSKVTLATPKLSFL